MTAFPASEVKAHSGFRIRFRLDFRQASATFRTNPPQTPEPNRRPQLDGIERDVAPLLPRGWLSIQEDISA